MKYTFRPLHDKTWLNPKARRSTRFSASWSDTLDLQLATTPAAPSDPWQTLTALAGADVANDRASIIRRARRNAHPDTGGSHELWLQFTAAYDALPELEAHRA